VIIAQTLFSVAILVVCFKFLASPNSNQTRAWKKILLLLLLVFALVAVFFPNVTNDLAHVFGIGRGADLLLYTLTLVFLFGELNRYVKQKEEQRKIVIIVRKIAIMEANERYR
jgi:hypothetical protein